jgi:peroxiredoxin
MAEFHRPGHPGYTAFRRLATALAVLTFAFTLACDASASATVGEPAPGFTLTDLHGEEHSLSDYRDRVVVLEWINPKCPFSERHAKEGTMIELAGRDVVWLAVNSTNPEARDHMTPEEHLAYNRKYGIEYPVLEDPTGEVGKAYGAKTTPQMYVIGEDGTLLYDGAIDDDPLARSDPEERTNYVASALEALGAGRAVEPATTKPYGCTVKY